jgi:hypothetical protein
MRLRDKLSFFRGFGSKPSTVLITRKGETGWNYCEGWENTLKELNLPFRSFHVGNKPKKIQALFSHLKKNPPELILLSCGDHHLFNLHDTEEKRDFWRSLKSKTVCFCSERVVNSPFPDSEAKTRSAISAFDGFAYVDEFAGPLFDAAGKPAMWTTQFSDDKLFRERVPFEQRINQVYFRATLTNFGLKAVYDERRRLIESVAGDRSFVIHDRLLSSKDYAKELSAQRFVLRAASNCPGYVENFWNALACGCVTFHQKLPSDEVKSLGLITPGKDFLEYDASKPDELIARVHEVLKNWREFKTVSERGRQTFLEKYTLRIFLERLLEFANTMVRTK